MGLTLLFPMCACMYVRVSVCVGPRKVPKISVDDVLCAQDVSFETSLTRVCVCVFGVLRCVCAEGFEGDSCEINFDDCEDNDCENNSTCVDGINNYTCMCSPEYTGEGRLCSGGQRAAGGKAPQAEACHPQLLYRTIFNLNGEKKPAATFLLGEGNRRDGGLSCSLRCFN